METKKLNAQPEIDFDLSLARTLVPLKNMGHNHLLALLNYASTQFIYAGQTILLSGAADNTHIYLLYGDVLVRDSDGNEDVIKGREALCPLAHNQPRLHTVVAKTDCATLTIDSVWLDKLLTWSQVADYLSTVISRERNFDEDIEWMMTILKSNLFFKVPSINVEKIFSHITIRLVNKGDIIIHEGELGDECYFIKEGRAEVTQAVNQTVNVLAFIENGRCFGEDALVNEAPRSATVTMVSDGVLMCLEKHNFYQLLKEPEVSMITLSEFDALGNASVMVDVRSDEEYATSHYPGAVNIPLHLLAIKSRQLLPTVDYVLYCNTGRRSKAATYLLSEQSFRVKCLKDSTSLFNHQKEAHRLIAGEDHVLRHGLPVQGE